MGKVAVLNNTAMPIYVGSAMIPAGETRHFEEADVPAHLRPVPTAAPVEAPQDPLKDLWGGSAKEVIAAIPALSDEDLKRLSEMESGRMLKDKPAVRTSVLAAIQEEVLKRADVAAQKRQDGNGGGSQE